MWINLIIGFFLVSHICLSIAIVLIVLLQRGEDGAFSRSTIHNIIRTSINTLFSKTWKLILFFCLHTIILGALIHNKYYDKSKYIYYDTLIVADHIKNS